MIIAVNTRLLLKEKLEGIGWFAYETLKRITQNHPEHQFIFIFDRKYSDEFVFSDNIRPIVAHPQARHPVLWYLYFDWGIPHLLKKYKADIFLSPDGWLSLRTEVKSLPVIHDLNFFHYPNFATWFNRKYYYHFFPKFIKKATRIATVSEFSKSDIASQFGVNPDKIDVVYNGARDVLTPLDEQSQEEVRKKHTDGCPFFLFIGLIHRRKNVDNLIKAFDEFKQSVTSNLKLLIVGSKKYWNEEIQAAYDNSQFKDDIIFTGRMKTEDLNKVVASATALVYVSHFEGFGIPILEAMYCDVPVITSRVSSMPEVGGEAAIYVEPTSVDSIKDAMLRVFCDTNLRELLIERARIQRSRFTWDKTADLLWQSIEKCAGINPDI
jgi:glycosyltransferase involved in cell wall biosynthesis